MEWTAKSARRSSSASSISFTKSPLPPMSASGRSVMRSPLVTTCSSRVSSARLGAAEARHERPALRERQHRPARGVDQRPHAMGSQPTAPALPDGLPWNKGLFSAVPRRIHAILQVFLVAAAILLGARTASANADSSTPDPMTLEVPGQPDAYFYKPRSKSMRPILMYLHGRGGNAMEDCRKWARVAPQFGWVVCPQGPRRRDNGGRAWNNDADSAKQIIDATVAALKARYKGRVRTRGNILIGFSEGAFIALQVGLRDPSHWSRWLILAANDKYWWGDAPQLLEQNRAKIRRVYLFTGENDEVAENTKRAGEMLKDAHIRVQREDRPGPGPRGPRRPDDHATTAARCAGSPPAKSMRCVPVTAWCPVRLRWRRDAIESVRHLGKRFPGAHLREVPVGARGGARRQGRSRRAHARVARARVAPGDGQLQGAGRAGRRSTPCTPRTGARTSWPRARATTAPRSPTRARCSACRRRCASRARRPTPSGARSSDAAPSSSSPPPTTTTTPRPSRRSSPSPRAPRSCRRTTTWTWCSATAGRSGSRSRAPSGGCRSRARAVRRRRAGDRPGVGHAVRERRSGRRSVWGVQTRPRARWPRSSGRGGRAAGDRRTTLAEGLEGGISSDGFARARAAVGGVVVVTEAQIGRAMAPRVRRHGPRARGERRDRARADPRGPARGASRRATSSSVLTGRNVDPERLDALVHRAG